MISNSLGLYIGIINIVVAIMITFYAGRYSTEKGGLVVTTAFIIFSSLLIFTAGIMEVVTYFCY